MRIARKLKKTKGEKLSKLSKRARGQSIKVLRQLAWKLLSKCIRQEAAGFSGYINCYTCQTTHHWKDIQAGHGIGGRHNAVLLDEEIIKPQCSTCNIFKRGNYQVFVTNLIKERSFEWWELKLANSRQLKVYTAEELKEKIEGYRERLKFIETKDMEVPF